MQSYKMEVSKKENGAYVRQGEIEVYYPLLNELGLSVEAEKNDEEGFPIYTDEKVQYVFDAVLAAVKAQARNKLVSGTATLKPGLSIASTVEELLESGGNKGDALAAVREFLAAFKAWLPKTGKSEKVQAAVYELARVLNVAEAWLMGYDVPPEREHPSEPKSAEGRPTIPPGFIPLPKMKKA